MISLSPKAKEKYAKYVGPDGKLIIDESVPENLRETFQYFNDNNINILELNIERNYTSSEEDFEPQDSEGLEADDSEIEESRLLVDDDETFDAEEELEDFF